MSGIEQASNDLFFKLRNRFPHINMADDSSKTTTDPEKARFFNFDYEESEIKFGNITASLADNTNLKLFFSQDITQYMDRAEKQNWYKFLQEIRKFAKSHMLGLDVRDINKDTLSQKDLKFVSDRNREKNQLGESRVLWARRGKVSEGNVGNVRVHVVHSERMDENPNNRLLRVDRIFLVNESGERFLLPFKSVMAAKAMANHVGRGGNPYDPTGKVISTAVNEMMNLRRFASATRRKTFESEDAAQVITAAQAIKESIKRSLFRLANNSRFDENVEDLNKLLAEQEDVEDIKPFFTQNIYNENLDNWINSAAKAFNKYKGNIMENLRESAGTVAQKLSDPQWRLVLKDEPSEDRLIATSKYADGRALLRRVLGTIADRVSMEDSDVANWSSQIGQDIEDNKASREDMQIALQLAKKYQDDLRQINSNPDYANEVRVSAFGTRKTLGKRDQDEGMEFEQYVHGIGEEDDMDEADSHSIRNTKTDRIYHISKYPITTNHTIYKKIKAKDPDAQIHKNGQPVKEEVEIDEAGPEIKQDERNPLPPMSAGERIQQKLGTGAFAPRAPQPVNTEPLPGSPGPSQADKDALKGIIDKESEEDTSTAAERISERVAGRTTTNESLDTMLWLSGLKKKSDINEADAVMPRVDDSNAFMPKSTAPDMPRAVGLDDFMPKSTAPDVTVNKPRYSFTTDKGFTQLPDKGFQPAPKLGSAIQSEPTGKGPFDIKVTPDDKIGQKQVATPGIGDLVGKAVTTLAPKLALPLALVTPSDQLAGPEKDELNYSQDIAAKRLVTDPTPAIQQRAPLRSMPIDNMPLGTITDPNLIPTEKQESISLLKTLAGIGK